VLKNAAQAVGATYGDRHIGTFGTAVFSLYATKNVMTGEGGMITTDSDRSPIWRGCAESRHAQSL